MDAAAGAMRASEIDARRANLAACHRICRTMRPRGSPASARRQPAQTQGPANPPQAWRMPGVPWAHPGASDSHESTKGSRGRPSRRLCGPHATGVCVRAVNRETRLWGRSAHRMRSSWQTLVERILHPMVAMPFFAKNAPSLAPVRAPASASCRSHPLEPDTDLSIRVALDWDPVVVRESRNAW